MDRPQIEKKISVEFEVFGRVQKVYFRKFTKQQSEKLQLKGWCKNTNRGTVVGVLEGQTKNVQYMKNWLRTTGSPSSIIEKCVFKNERAIPNHSYIDFKIIK